MEEESPESGTTSAPAETLTQTCSDTDAESENIQIAEEANGNDSAAGDGEAGEDHGFSGGETLAQDAVMTTSAEEDDDCLPGRHLSAEEDVNPPLEASNPSAKPNAPSEPCWYCLRSLDSEYPAKDTQLEEQSEPGSPLPSSGQKVTYQTDPRPHFGVACSSHSTCRPLWGSEGPCWGQRNQEAAEQTDTCPHCHLGLATDTLRWHEEKCLLFEGPRSSKKEN